MNDFYTQKKDIIVWLDKYKISNYELVPDKAYGFVINVGGHVELNEKDLDYIPVKFNEIKKGGFYCNKNNLTSLEGCPIKVEYNFNCSNNKLKNLKGCPEHVGGYFYCNRNALERLYYCPKVVEKNLLECLFNPGLGDIQSELHFKEIYQEHLKIKKVIDFNEKMNNDLMDKKTNTIKKNKI